MTDLEAITEVLMKLVDAAGLRAVVILVDDKNSCLMTNLLPDGVRDALDGGRAQFPDQLFSNLGKPN